MRILKLTINKSSLHGSKSWHFSLLPRWPEGKTSLGTSNANVYGGSSFNFESAGFLHSCTEPRGPTHFRRYKLPQQLQILYYLSLVGAILLSVERTTEVKTHEGSLKWIRILNHDSRDITQDMLMVNKMICEPILKMTATLETQKGKFKAN